MKYRSSSHWTSSKAAVLEETEIIATLLFFLFINDYNLDDANWSTLRCEPTHALCRDCIGVATWQARWQKAESQTLKIIVLVKIYVFVSIDVAVVVVDVVDVVFEFVSSKLGALLKSIKYYLLDKKKQSQSNRPAIDDDRRQLLAWCCDSLLWTIWTIWTTTTKKKQKRKPVGMKFLKTKRRFCYLFTLKIVEIIINQSKTK